MYEGQWAMLCDVRLEKSANGQAKVFRASGLACPACGSPGGSPCGDEQHGCTLEERSHMAVNDPGPGASLVLAVDDGTGKVYINGHYVDVGDDFPAWLGLYDAAKEGTTFMPYEGAGSEYFADYPTGLNPEERVYPLDR